jgi:hypothetical protein
MSQHIDLAVPVPGFKIVEPVHVEPLGENSYKILYSPRLVRGVAAGDVVELIDSSGYFRVLSRGGNVSVRVYPRCSVSLFKSKLEYTVSTRLKGTCDGIDEDRLVFTIPVTTGFPLIEEVFDKLASEYQGLEWAYGNVYDPETNGPLGWWNKRTESRSGQPRSGR